VRVRNQLQMSSNIHLLWYENIMYRNCKKSYVSVLTYFFLNLLVYVIYSYSTTNKMHLFLKLFILVKCSTCFRQPFRPSSGAQNCTYGNRHKSHSCCYLLLAGTKWNSILSLLTAGSISCVTYACCCMCSFELLMMDRKTIQNM